MFAELDIVNSKQSTWLGFFQDRLWKMEEKRKEFDDMWDNFDNNVTAVSFYDNEWNLNVNIPLEKTLKEIYMWRTDWKISYDIVPDGQADVEELQPAKYALNFFLDWNWKDNFWKENKRNRDLKSHYGSAIFYTWIRKYIDYRYDIKEDADINWNEDLLSEKNFEEKENITWFFHPKAIHPRDFYVDDNAYGSPDMQKAEDCIYKEKLTATELELRYWRDKTFNIDGVWYYIDPEPKNKNDEWVSNRSILLYHYFNRITKTYLIVANRKHIIYSGKYLYNDGKLPFDNIQHYTNENRFRWEWIPERVSYLKAYKSEVFQDILTGAEMASWINLVVWNDDEVGQDWTIWGRQMNLWRTTWWADRVQPINTSINLWFFTAVLDLIEKQVTIDTWINPTEQFDPISDKVGIVEIMEANKAVRNRSVDENYNIWLDNILTMTLARIKQFAPSLLSEKIQEWEVTKVIFPSIRIDNYKVERKWGKQIFTESIWKYWYFELKPDVVQWVWVKVVTASTNSILPILERQKVAEYMTNVVTPLVNLATADQTWETMTKLKEWLRFEDLLWWVNDSYGYDMNWLKANTEKDKIAKANLEKLKKLKEVLSINPTQNVWETSWVPMQGQAWETPNPMQWAWEGINPLQGNLQ